MCGDGHVVLAIACERHIRDTQPLHPEEQYSDVLSIHRAKGQGTQPCRDCQRQAPSKRAAGPFHRDGRYKCTSRACVFTGQREASSVLIQAGSSRLVVSQCDSVSSVFQLP